VRFGASHKVPLLFQLWEISSDCGCKLGTVDFRITCVVRNKFCLFISRFEDNSHCRKTKGTYFSPANFLPFTNYLLHFFTCKKEKKIWKKRFKHKGSDSTFHEITWIFSVLLVVSNHFIALMTKPLFSFAFVHLGNGFKIKLQLTFGIINWNFAEIFHFRDCREI